MNKEEILAKSRKENKGKDIEYLETESKAGSLSAMIAAIYAGIMYFVEIFFTEGKFNYSLWAVVTVMNSTIQLYMFFKLKKKTHLFLAIPWTLLSIGLTIAAISSFVNVN